MIAQFLLDFLLGVSLLLLGGLVGIDTVVLELLLKQFGFHALRHRDVEAILQLGEERVTSFSRLTALGILLSGLAHISLELVERVILGSFLSEVVVKLRELFRLNGVDLDLDLSFLALMLAGFQRAFEGGFLACRQAFKRLIQTVEHGA